MEHHSDTNLKYDTESDQTFGGVDIESPEEIDTNIMDSEEEMAYDLIGISPNFVVDFTETAEEDDPVIKQWINDVGDVYEDIKDEESGPIGDEGDTESLAVSVPCEEQTYQCEREEIVDSEDDMASISDIMKSSYDSITELLDSEEERDEIVESDEELSPLSDPLKSSNESIDQLLEYLNKEELSINDDHVIDLTEQIESDDESASSETEPWQFNAPEQMNETATDSASTLSWEDTGDNADRHSSASSSAFEDPVNIEYEINGDEEPDECTICLDELLEICCFIDPCGHKGYLHDNNTFL